jgi:4a-hydroxytetrahydrobiopterin dehydratase
MNTTQEGLQTKSCKPCQGEEDPLKGDELAPYRNQINGEWEVVKEHHLKRVFSFDDFAQALAFTNRVGEIAEQEQHHPDIALTYGKVTIQLFTHKIGGLSERDFIVASKIDRLQHA